MAQPPSCSTPGSISIELGQAAVDCYLSALLATAKSLPQTCPHIGAQYESRLLRMRQRVAFKPTSEGLTESLRALEEDLDAFSRRTSAYYEQKAGDVATLLNLLQKEVETFEGRDLEYLERMGRLAAKLKAMLDSGADAGGLRAAAKQQYSEMQNFLEDLSVDSRNVFERLSRELGAYEERLIRSEAEASIDPLTALVNRRELERLIQSRTVKGRVFTLLLFDIRSLHTVNERFGQEAGDQVLRQFGARLMAQVRPRDVVARWAGDEFAVIFDCPALDANPRAQQIAQWLTGKYPVIVKGQEWKPEVEASVAVVEYQPGEHPADFVLRANAHVPTEAPDLMEQPL